jgi:hypothetical protein
LQTPRPEIALCRGARCETKCQTFVVVVDASLEVSGGINSGSVL